VIAAIVSDDDSCRGPFCAALADDTLGVGLGARGAIDG
jgi:hypothetical protein